MKSVKKITCLMVVLCGLSGHSFAQDIHFSQLFTSQLGLNPSYAGANYDMQATLNYKDQWRSVGAPYKTFAGSMEMRIKGKRKSVKNGFFAAGIQFFSDKAGDAKIGTSQGSLNLAYHVKLDDYNKLGAGIQTGFFQRSVTPIGLQWANQYNGNFYDPQLSSEETISNNSFTNFDLGSGILWSYDNTDGRIKVTDNHDLRFNLGFSIYHLTQPKYSFVGSSEKLYMKYVLTGGGLISIPDTKFAIVPGFMYYRQGPAQEIYAGSLFRYILTSNSKVTGINTGSAIYAGAYLRTKDAISAQLMYEYAGFTFGLSYDINVSGLKQASSARGGIEFSLRFISPNPFSSMTKSTARI